MPRGYQNIEAGIQVNPMKYQELNRSSLSVETSPLVEKGPSLKAKKVAAFVLCASLFALAALSSAGPNAALLGHRHSHADATSEAPPADGFCCHYATVAADACNTCMAPSTTGHCAIAAANCSSCGGQWCLPPTPAPTTVDFVAPPAPTPGICCHYALDADDICGTCKAPDNGNCGKDAESCGMCGGGGNTGWCQELTAPKGAATDNTSASASFAVDLTAPVATATDGSAPATTAAAASTPTATTDDTAAADTTDASAASSEKTDDNDNTPF